MAEITQIDLGLVVGDTGATGATGPTGPQGPGATISVGSVTTTTYGNPAQVTNSGTATDAVLDFVIPQGAPGEEVTDVSSLTLNSITETAASFPVPAVGDVMSVVMGKVKKFFADTVAALNTKLNKSNVVNDLTYTTEGYALDARAGKTLKTQIDSLNDSITALSDSITALSDSFANINKVKAFSYTLESTAFTQNVPVRFNVPLQTGETNVNNRMSILPLEDADLTATLTSAGRIYVSSSMAKTTVARVRIFYF